MEYAEHNKLAEYILQRAANHLLDVLDADVERNGTYWYGTMEAVRLLLLLLCNS
jgi:hypothetical protein